MIVLDTNVVSESLKPKPDPNVIAWLDRQDPATLYLAAPSLAELLLGVELLPNGKRRQGLAAGLEQLIAAFFGPRILAFDGQAAKAYAFAVARARASGKGMSIIDAQIAAVASCHRYAVATRDAPPFKAAGVPVVDPWLPPS
jgi:toxin FitB